MIMACRLNTLDKSPKFRPLGIRDIIFCLILKCVLLVTCTTSIEACGNINLCYGLRSGIDETV